MLEIAWFSNTIIVAAIGKSAPNFAAGFGDSEELGHVRWSAFAC